MADRTFRDNVRENIVYICTVHVHKEMAGRTFRDKVRENIAYICTVHYEMADRKCVHKIP